MKKEGEPEQVGSVLSRILGEAFCTDAKRVAGSETLTKVEPSSHLVQEDEAPGRFDFDLAEFPLFDFYKNRVGTRTREPLVYSDTIQGQDGQQVTRTWKAYPGAFGFGSASTQVLFYDLLQLYVEQGARGTQIQFGTLRSLLLRRGERNPSKRDYDRTRKDIDILRGYDFHCTNAFWDRAKRAYVDMNWRLFGSVFYFKPLPNDSDHELPFGFLEVSSVLKEIARTRGFFSLGFGSKLFYDLKPVEQRLAVYLAKKFVSQKVHRRFVEDLARAIPVSNAHDYDTRKVIKYAAGGLLKKRLPILADFRLEKSTDGRWLATFVRGEAPRQDSSTVSRAATALAPTVLAQVERIIDAVGSGDDHLWWARCVERLGQGPIDRGLGLLKEARQSGKVRNPGGLLTTFFKSIAKEMGVVIH